MAKAKKSNDRGNRGAAEPLCEKICRELLPELAFKEIKRSKEYGYEKEVAKIVEEMSSCQPCDESVSPERMKLASEIKEVLEQRRLHKEDGGKNYLTPNHKELLEKFLTMVTRPPEIKAMEEADKASNDVLRRAAANLNAEVNSREMKIEKLEADILEKVQVISEKDQVISEMGQEIEKLKGLLHEERTKAGSGSSKRRKVKSSLEPAPIVKEEEPLSLDEHADQKPLLKEEENPAAKEEPLQDMDVNDFFDPAALMKLMDNEEEEKPHEQPISPK